MRTSLPIIALLASFVSVCVTPGLAQEPQTPSLTVQATGEATRVPDMASVVLEVSRTETTARAALDANTAAMAAVLAAMKDAGIEERDLQTSSFNIRPEVRYDEPRTEPGKPPSPPVVTGYTVSNALTVRIRDIAKVGTILDQAVTLGMNSGGQISFASSHPEEAQEEARKDAVKRALAKAATLTEAAGVTLGPVMTIQEVSLSAPVPQRMRLAEASMAGDVPIAAGERTTRVSVTMRFEIIQKK